MGRVRRYKQIKQCDPFAKKRTVTKKKEEREMDLPPPPEPVEDVDLSDDDEHLIKRKDRKGGWAWSIEDDTSPRQKPRAATKKEDTKVVIEPKRRDESQREFRQRLKRQGAQFMKQAVDAASKSKARRKRKLQERTELKKLRKQKRKGRVVEEDRIDITDRVDRPPDLRVRPKFKRQPRETTTKKPVIMERVRSSSGIARWEQEF